MHLWTSQVDLCLNPTLHEPWTPEEEGKLIAGFKAGLKVAELAKEHGRKKGGISSRLKKLGLGS